VTTDTIILGAGVTGLAVGLASGHPIYEAQTNPGGICASYYIKPGEKTPQNICPEDQEAYHFEYGGGHWIFGGDSTVLKFIDNLTPIQSYARRSSVYFHQQDLYVPYALQNHLGYLGKEIAAKALSEITSASKGTPRTMADWLVHNFGKTLTDLFFGPFHQAYTAGLWTKIAPQDAYKSPVSLPLVVQGAFEKTPPVGYNATFVYPKAGLNVLTQKMAAQCDIHYGKKVVQIDADQKKALFADGSGAGYETLITTLPLNQILQMAGLEVNAEPDPYTSVLVINIGATKGSKCPNDQWLYNFNTKSGFHRVGFYSHVDACFLPLSSREKADRVSIYVERAYPGSQKPTETEIEQYSKMVVQELQDWGFIQDAEVVHPTWVDVAYTWSWPGSTWKQQAIQTLEKHGIYPIGRYGRWIFQGIADSLKDGFFVGAGLRNY
jgi:protoporphyrinogen oxidase